MTALPLSMSTPLISTEPAALPSRVRGGAARRDGLKVERETFGSPSRRNPMAIAVQKITLSSSRDITFNKLVLNQSNVRRVGSSETHISRRGAA